MPTNTCGLGRGSQNWQGRRGRWPWLTEELSKAGGGEGRRPRRGLAFPLAQGFRAALRSRRQQRPHFLWRPVPLADAQSPSGFCPALPTDHTQQVLEQPAPVALTSAQGTSRCPSARPRTRIQQKLEMVHLLKGLGECPNPRPTYSLDPGPLRSILCWTEAPGMLRAPDAGEEAREAASHPRAVHSLCPSQGRSQESGRKLVSRREEGCSQHEWVCPSSQSRAPAGPADTPACSRAWSSAVRVPSPNEGAAGITTFAEGQRVKRCSLGCGGQRARMCGEIRGSFLQEAASELSLEEQAGL